MPRVNRDLQRRMAARRERERRRPTERRYRFAPAEPTQLPDDEIAENGPDGAPVAEARSAAAPRPARGATPRQAPRPFSEYRDEYRYVFSDLRRIALVIGSLLLVLIVLSLVLPR
jgi:hypothetical protein